MTFLMNSGSVGQCPFEDWSKNEVVIHVMIAQSRWGAKPRSKACAQGIGNTVRKEVDRASERASSLLSGMHARKKHDLHNRPFSKFFVWVRVTGHDRSLRAARSLLFHTFLLWTSREATVRRWTRKRRTTTMADRATRGVFSNYLIEKRRSAQ